MGNVSGWQTPRLRCLSGPADAQGKNRGNAYDEGGHFCVPGGTMNSQTFVGAMGTLTVQGS
ncbi:MAG: hypothetical protein RLZ55_1625 [Actinomycetota bacterium]